MRQDFQQLLTRSACARLLHKSPEKVQAWINEGILRAVMLPDGSVRIRRTDLDDFLEQRTLVPRMNGSTCARKTWF
jgi:excisionase family DNA binding protein